MLLYITINNLGKIKLSTTSINIIYDLLHVVGGSEAGVSLRVR